MVRVFLLLQYNRAVKWHENNGGNHFKYPKTSTQATLRQDKLQILLSHSESAEGPNVTCTAAVPTEELSQHLQWPAQRVVTTWNAGPSTYRYSNVTMSAQQWQHLNAHGHSALSELMVSLYFLLVMVYFIENTPACGTLISTSSRDKEWSTSMESAAQGHYNKSVVQEGLHSLCPEVPVVWTN